MRPKYDFTNAGDGIDPQLLTAMAIECIANELATKNKLKYFEIKVSLLNIDKIESNLISKDLEKFFDE